MITLRAGELYSYKKPRYHVEDKHIATRLIRHDDVTLMHSRQTHPARGLLARS